MLSLCRWNHFKVIAALRHIGIDSLFDRVPQTYRGRLLTTSPGGGSSGADARWRRGVRRLSTPCGSHEGGLTLEVTGAPTGSSPS
jgi:hypothetical protein